MKMKSVGRGKKSEEKKSKKSKKSPKKIKSALQKKPTLKQLLSGRMDTNEYEIRGTNFKKVPNGLSPEKCAAIRFCGAPEGHVLHSLAVGFMINMTHLLKEIFSVKGYSPDFAKGLTLLRRFLRGEEMKESVKEPVPAKPVLKAADNKVTNKEGQRNLDGLNVWKNGDFTFEGMILYAKETSDQGRVDVYVLQVRDSSHPDYESLKAIAGQMYCVSTYMARSLEKYPREKLSVDSANKADSLEALWRLVRRALGVTAPLQSAELKKVA